MLSFSGGISGAIVELWKTSFGAWFVPLSTMRLTAARISCVPQDYRKNLYTVVQTNTLYVGSNQEAHILVVLMRKEDVLEQFEEKLPSALQITRSLRQVSLSVRLDHTLSSLYRKSLEHEFYQQRLFGPQVRKVFVDLCTPTHSVSRTRRRSWARRG
jgi:hypothetical protein